MIGRIKGTVVYISTDHAIVDVAGVGYIVHCSHKNLSTMELNSAVILFVETYVREDQISLYGFRTTQEKNCFLKLTIVKGIGPKLALLILSSLTVDQIYLGITHKDQKAFTSVSGVGPKIINRIFAELKPSDFYDNLGENIATLNNNEIKNDAISALINLGINKNEAYTVVSNIILKQHDIDLNNLIRLSLSEVSK